MENLHDVLESAKLAARTAGIALASRIGLTARSASQRDTKLEADSASESMILDMLSRNYPVLSEEMGGIISHKSPTWIVDPLDGTVNYSREIPISCVSIGLWNDGPIMGVVYDFTRDEMFTGIVGDGAFLNDEKIQVSGISNPSDAIVYTGFPVASSFETACISEFVNIVQGYKKVRLLGSAALSLAYVACGRGDAYIEQNIRIWDVAAGLALVKAAGGSIKYFGDDPLVVTADNGSIDCR